MTNPTHNPQPDQPRPPYQLTHLLDMLRRQDEAKARSAAAQEPQRCSPSPDS